MAVVEKVRKIWMDGKLVDWEAAQVHVLTHTLHYGMGVFEGIRCYRTEDGQSAVFRLKEHVDRLFDSAHIVQMTLPSTREDVASAVLETLRANDMREGYIRPLAFIGEGAMGLYATDNPVHLTIVAWPWGTYLGEEGLRNGIRAKISSFTRHHVNVAMTKAKVCGYYVNSIMAKREAMAEGYDEAIMLDADGFVAEASGENLFMVRDGGLFTPPLTSVLPGITRHAIMRIARDKGIPLEERRFSRDELYTADEAFLTGTAAEVTPIREVDRRRVGEGTRGPVTHLLQDAFFNIVKGKDAKYEEWLTRF
ncbi:MAG: branched-chain amino acid transaminase [Deltaproteobacteria bacterium]|nr:branched-chain amino acid transaminase [Deltaproteobacteria bacterium]